LQGQVQTLQNGGARYRATEIQPSPNGSGRGEEAVNNLAVLLLHAAAKGLSDDPRPHWLCGAWPDPQSSDRARRREPPRCAARGEAPDAGTKDQSSPRTASASPDSEACPPQDARQPPRNPVH